MANDDTQKLDESSDDGSSLEKSIEHLNKDDPNYEAKRDKLLNRLTAFRKELDNTRLQIKKQQKETRETLSSLRQKASQNPQDENLSLLVDKTKEDSLFLTRAAVELVSAKGNLQQDVNRLTSSKTFHQPVDMSILTQVQIKPLPSSQISKKKGKSKETPHQKSSSEKIQNLRFSLPQRSFPSHPRQPVKTHERS